MAYDDGRDRFIALMRLERELGRPPTDAELDAEEVRMRTKRWASVDWLRRLGVR